MAMVFQCTSHVVTVLESGTNCVVALRHVTLDLRIIRLFRSEFGKKRKRLFEILKPGRRLARVEQFVPQLSVSSGELPTALHIFRCVAPEGFANS